MWMSMYSVRRYGKPEWTFGQPSRTSGTLTWCSFKCNMVQSLWVTDWLCSKNINQQFHSRYLSQRMWKIYVYSSFIHNSPGNNQMSITSQIEKLCSSLAMNLFYWKIRRKIPLIHTLWVNLKNIKSSRWMSPSKVPSMIP